MCRTLLIFLRAQRANQSGPPRYPEHVLRTHRNFLQSSEKIFYLQKWSQIQVWSENPLSKPGWEFLTKPRFDSIFGGKNFFQRPVKNFLCVLSTCFGYLGGPLWSVLCARKKIRTPRRFNLIQSKEKWEKLGFWKIHSPNRVGNLWPNLDFWR